MTRSESKKQENSRKRNLIADLAIEGARKKNCGKMCDSCVFKRDSEANLHPTTVNQAMDTIISGQFNCHIGNGMDRGHPCYGFLNALQNFPPDDRKLTYENPAYIFNCPACKKEQVDNNEKLKKRCDNNKSGFTKTKCSCGCTMYLHYDFTNRIEVFDYAEILKISKLNNSRI